MAATVPARYTMDHGGQQYEVETESSGLHTVARLFIDGVQADEQKGIGGPIRLTGGDLFVVVNLGFLGNVTEILAVPSGTDPDQVNEKVKAEGIAFSAPVGSRAARMQQFRRDHPELYAARHVVMAVLQVLVGVLGIGALLRALLPRLSLPDLPWPEIDLPAIPLPAIDLPAIPWPGIPWPQIDLPDLSHLAWIKDLWNSVNWLVPIVIAIVVALNELDKRRKREKAEKERRVTGS